MTGPFLSPSIWVSECRSGHLRLKADERAREASLGPVPSLTDGVSPGGCVEGMREGCEPRNAGRYVDPDVSSTGTARKRAPRHATESTPSLRISSSSTPYART